MTAVGTSSLRASVDTATVTGRSRHQRRPRGGRPLTLQTPRSRARASTSQKVLASGQAANVPLGAQVTYDLVVTNTGDTTLTTVPLADTFNPAQLEIVSTSVQPTGAPLPGVVSWPNVAAPLGIAPGASVRVPVTFRTLVAGPNIPDVATVTGAVDVIRRPGGQRCRYQLDPRGLRSRQVRHLEDGEPRRRHHRPAGRHDHLHPAWNNTQQVTVPDVVITDPLPASVNYTAGSMRLGTASQTDAADADAGTFNAPSRHGELPSRQRERDVERHGDIQGRRRAGEGLEPPAS